MSDILDRAEDLRDTLAHKAEWHDESQIVKELIDEIKRQAAYVARLEAAYVELCKDCYFRPFDWNDHTDEAKTKAEKHARDALERIKDIGADGPMEDA